MTVAWQAKRKAPAEVRGPVMKQKCADRQLRQARAEAKVHAALALEDDRDSPGFYSSAVGLDVVPSASQSLALPSGQAHASDSLGTGIATLDTESILSVAADTNRLRKVQNAALRKQDEALREALRDYVAHNTPSTVAQLPGDSCGIGGGGAFFASPGLDFKRLTFMPDAASMATRITKCVRGKPAIYGQFSKALLQLWSQLHTPVMSHPQLLPPEMKALEDEADAESFKPCVFYDYCICDKDGQNVGRFADSIEKCVKLAFPVHSEGRVQLVHGVICVRLTGIATSVEVEVEACDPPKVVVYFQIPALYWRFQLMSHRMDYIEGSIDDAATGCEL